MTLAKKGRTNGEGVGVKDGFKSGDCEVKRSESRQKWAMRPIGCVGRLATRTSNAFERQSNSNVSKLGDRILPAFPHVYSEGVYKL